MAKGHPEKINVITTTTGSGFTSDWKFYDHASETFTFDKNNHSNMKKVDYHYLEFVLVDQANTGLCFPPDPHDAMWVKRKTGSGKTCPGPSDHDYKVLHPMAVVDSTSLIVFNPNRNIEDWAFSLNFVHRTDPTKTAQWDPIGNNQDGGRSFTLPQFLTVGAIGFAAGVIFAFAFASLTNWGR